MPYNPGVADQSGQILANGINNTLATYAQDMLRMQENEQKRRAAAGQIQGLLASDPSLAQRADPALVQKLGAGKANLADTMQLLGMLSAVKSSDNEQLNAKLNQAKMDQIGQQNQMLQQQILAMQQQQAAASRNTAAVGTALNGPYAQPAADNPAAMIQRAAANGADVETLERLARTAETVAQARQRSAPGPQGLVFPSRAEAEARYPGAQFQYAIDEDPATGSVRISDIKTRGQGQSQPNKFQEAIDTKVGQQVADLMGKVPAFESTLDQTRIARQALAAGAPTGDGESLGRFKLAAAQTLNGLTGLKIWDTSKGEVLQNSIANMALDAAKRMEGSGQISDAERKRLDATILRYGDTPQAMLAVLDFMEAKAHQQLGKARAANALIAQGRNQTADFTPLLTAWEKDNPIDYDALGRGSSPAAKPTAPARAAPTSGPALPPGWSIRN